MYTGQKLKQWNGCVWKEKEGRKKKGKVEGVMGAVLQAQKNQF